MKVFMLLFLFATIAQASVNANFKEVTCEATFSTTYGTGSFDGRTITYMYWETDDSDGFHTKLTVKRENQSRIPGKHGGWQRLPTEPESIKIVRLSSGMEQGVEFIKFNLANGESVTLSLGNPQNYQGSNAVANVKARDGQKYRLFCWSK